ncbi:hypothetical protein AB4114_11175 [Paenibacillus sp. 2RAB27]|uniref:hypothetical protein n=1 Tax=Paenibacillus sp. 2RAB27 TaxID=3232991 RepID=UPI003F9A60F0
MNIKSIGSRIIVNLKAPSGAKATSKPLKSCPECGSARVYTEIIVSGPALVNVNTLELWEQPDDCDCCWSDVASAGEFTCTACDHEWTEEGK